MIIIEFSYVILAFSYHSSQNISLNSYLPSPVIPDLVLLVGLFARHSVYTADNMNLPRQINTNLKVNVGDIFRNRR